MRELMILFDFPSMKTDEVFIVKKEIASCAEKISMKMFLIQNSLAIAWVSF
jgi:hypothetical protein